MTTKLMIANNAYLMVMSGGENVADNVGSAN